MVRLEAIGKRYGTASPVLQDVSLTLEPGEFHILGGARGAGKTTLLRILSLAESPSRGRVEVFGTDAASASRDEKAELRRRIGIVFEDLRLVPHLSVRDNVALPLRLAGAAAPGDKAGDKAEADDNVGELLRWVGLADMGEAAPATLSGGDRLRVAIARAIVRRPDLLIADEPTAGGDGAAAKTLMHVFEHMATLGTTVLIATGDAAFAGRLPYRQLYLEAGRISLAPAA